MKFGNYHFFFLLLSFLDNEQTKFEWKKNHQNQVLLTYKWCITYYFLEILARDDSGLQKNSDSPKFILKWRRF